MAVPIQVSAASFGTRWVQVSAPSPYVIPTSFVSRRPIFRPTNFRRVFFIPAESCEALSPEFFIEEGSAETAILDLAKKRNADLIVIGAHGLGKVNLGWIGSTAHRVIRHADCPVLAVRS